MILALVGPSGSGKSVLSRALQAFYSVLREPERKDEILTEYEEVVVNAVNELLSFPTLLQKQKVVVKEIISHTTRAMRAGEINGVHYYFTDVPEFLSLDRFEESNIYGNWYGITKKGAEETLKTSEIAIAVVDRIGVESMRKKGVSVISIFMKTDLSTMLEHMIARGDSQEIIETRIEAAMTNKELVYPEADFSLDNRGSLAETLRRAVVIVEEIRKNNLH